MTAKNDITGDAIATKKTSEAYRNNYDMIFRKEKVLERIKEHQENQFSVKDEKQPKP